MAETTDRDERRRADCTRQRAGKRGERERRSSEWLGVVEYFIGYLLLPSSVAVHFPFGPLEQNSQCAKEDDDEKDNLHYTICIVNFDTSFMI